MHGMKTRLRHFGAIEEFPGRAQDFQNIPISTPLDVEDLSTAGASVTWAVLELGQASSCRWIPEPSESLAYVSFESSPTMTTVPYNPGVVQFLETKPSPVGVFPDPVHLKGSTSAGYLVADLDFSAFRLIESSLFWAGRPGNFRPLHHYKALRREILPTEKTHLHLVWFDETVFIKPLPLYLLNHAFYASKICPNPTLTPAARWLLYSYTQLIAHPIDLSLAHESHLLPRRITWELWVPLATSLAREISQHEFNGRLWYGALRLDRLNILCMLRMQPRGFFIEYHSKYGNFFQAKFKWLAITFFYISVLLASMQVVLATESGDSSVDLELGSNRALQKTCFWFGVLCMMLVVASLALVVALFLLLFVWNFAATRRYHLAMKAWQVMSTV
ncbi:hypothetical protein Dda_5561 [Drechslerella dactyloides]|uniref:Subtilisin-like serine protease n=1 Tax=Drechslerella dactyloides TaxID=74499 RepID=A0AAD6J0Q3_DREDA|nr:hypothetical protein Dda_5561 [Drechslerella dactyloides]